MPVGWGGADWFWGHRERDGGGSAREVMEDERKDMRIRVEGRRGRGRGEGEGAEAGEGGGRGERKGGDGRWKRN